MIGHQGQISTCKRYNRFIRYERLIFTTVSKAKQDDRS